MKYRLLFLLIICSFGLTTFAQSARSESNELNGDAEKQYQKRIKQSYLNGVYIPKDLADAFVQFNKLIEKPSQEKFKVVPEKIAAEKLFFSFGRWISYNYGFREGSRFSVYLNGLGLHHPEDMVNFVMIAYHRNLNKAKLDIKPLLEELITNREKLIEERKLKGELISSEKRKVEVHPDSLKQN